MSDPILEAAVRESSPDRRAFLGSSDAAAVIGASPWHTPYQLWQTKTASVLATDGPDDGVLRRGKRLEPVVLDMIGDEERKVARLLGGHLYITGRNIRHTDPEHAFLTAQLDAEGVVDHLAGERVNVEVKTVHPSKAKQWGEEGSDEIPLHYGIQCLHGLMVTRRSRTLVAALIGADDLRLYVVVRNEEVIGELRARMVAFWHEHVLGLVPPDPIALVDVNAMYRRDTGTTVTATPEIAAAVAALASIKQLQRELEERHEEHERAIKQAMAEASTLADAAGNRLATWRVVKREVFDQRAFAAAHMALAEQYRKTVEARTFRLAN